MPKEDRSDWVAVEPQFAAAATPEIPKARTAFQFFQKERADELKQQVRAQNGGQFSVALLGKTSHAAWQALDGDERAYFDDLAAQDRARFAAASHAADVAAMQRVERLRAERETLLLLDNEGGGTRTTRRALEKKQKKAARAEKRRAKKQKKGKDDNDDDDDDDDDDAGSDYKNKDDEEGSDDWDSDVLDSDDDDDDDDSNAPKKKKKKASPNKQPRQVSQKQLEYQARKRAEKEQKEAYIAERQADLRKSKADQAKRRLEFLLQQSDIFSHFGRVKEDTAKYGIQTAPPVTTPKKSGNKKDRRDNNDNDEQDLAEADEHEATFLTAQPTTLGFGKMRPYQLEGLNWMIRLQENGVNGILADEVSDALLKKI